MSSSDPWLTLGRVFDDCLARLTHPEYTLRVARLDNAPCGFALLHPRGVAGAPYIASVAVDPHMRNRGVGLALLNDAEAFFPHARHMFLCVSSFNLRARAFYERHGYRVTGLLENYIIDGADEVLMYKRLDRE